MQIARIIGHHSFLRTCRHFEHLVHRAIYTAEQLSVDKYVRDRENFQMSLQLGSSEQRKSNLKKRLQYKYCNPNLLMNELTHYLYTINDTREDFALLELAMDKFKNTEIDNVRRSSIGSIVMRMLHHFQQDELAIKLYSDPILRSKYFNGKHCLLLFFDLLFKQKQYTELLRHFQDLRERLESKQQLITRTIFVLVFATCYSQNTEKSFEYAKQLHDQYKESHITQDHLIFLSALALNQNAPHTADQLLLTLWPTSHEAIPTLRLIALLHRQKFVDALQLMRSVSVVYDGNRMEKNDVLSKGAIEEAEKLFNQFCDDERLRGDFKQLQENLKIHGYILDKDVRTMVFEPFRLSKMTNMQRNKMVLQAEFNRNNNYR